MLLLRTLEATLRKPECAFRVRLVLPVKGDPRKHQRLHLNYAYGAYFGKCLMPAALAGSKNIPVEYDRRDIRVMDVLDEKGSVLGQVRIQGTWARFPHDERLRRYVYRSARDSAFLRPDPLTEYWTNLTSRLDRPSEALRLFDLQVRMLYESEDQNGGQQNNSKESVEARSPTVHWSPRIAIPADEL